MVPIAFTYPIKEMHNYCVSDCEIDSFHSLTFLKLRCVLLTGVWRAVMTEL